MPDVVYLVSGCGTIDEFVAAFRRYADRVGLFVPTATPLAVARRLRLGLTLRDGQVVIEGDAEVITASTRPSGLHGRPGMTIRITGLDADSQAVWTHLEKARFAPAEPPATPLRARPGPTLPNLEPPPAVPSKDPSALAACWIHGDPTAAAPAPGPAPGPAAAGAGPAAAPRFAIPTIPTAPTGPTGPLAAAARPAPRVPGVPPVAPVAAPRPAPPPAPPAPASVVSPTPAPPASVVSPTPAPPASPPGPPQAHVLPQAGARPPAPVRPSAALVETLHSASPPAGQAPARPRIAPLGTGAAAPAVGAAPALESAAVTAALPPASHGPPANPLAARPPTTGLAQRAIEESSETEPAAVAPLPPGPDEPRTLVDPGLPSLPLVDPTVPSLSPVAPTGEVEPDHVEATSAAREGTDGVTRFGPPPAPPTSAPAAAPRPEPPRTIAAAEVVTQIGPPVILTPAMVDPITDDQATPEAIDDAPMVSMPTLATPDEVDDPRTAPMSAGEQAAALATAMRPAPPVMPPAVAAQAPLQPAAPVLPEQVKTTPRAVPSAMKRTMIGMPAVSRAPAPPPMPRPRVMVIPDDGGAPGPSPESPATRLRAATPPPLPRAATPPPVPVSAAPNVIVDPTPAGAGAIAQPPAALELDPPPLEPAPALEPAPPRLPEPAPPRLPAPPPPSALAAPAASAEPIASAPAPSSGPTPHVSGGPDGTTRTPFGRSPVAALPVAAPSSSIEIDPSLTANVEEELPPLDMAAGPAQGLPALPYSPPGPPPGPPPGFVPGAGPGLMPGPLPGSYVTPVHGHGVHDGVVAAPMARALTDAGTGFFLPDENGQPPVGTYSTGDLTAMVVDTTRRRRLVVIAASSLAVLLVVALIIWLIGAGDSGAPGRAVATAPVVRADAALPAAAAADAGAVVAAAVVDASDAGSAAAPADAAPSEVTPPPIAAGSCRARFVSKPPGSEVVIARAVVGRTPVSLELPCTKVSVTLRQPRYASVTRAVTPTAAGVTVTAKHTRPPASIKVTSVPPGAAVTVGGRKVGTTPATVKAQMFVPVTISVSKPGFSAASQAVTPKTATSQVKIVLKRR